MYVIIRENESVASEHLTGTQRFVHPGDSNPLPSNSAWGERQCHQDNKSRSGRECGGDSVIMN